MAIGHQVKSSQAQAEAEAEAPSPKSSLVLNSKLKTRLDKSDF